MKLVTSLKDLVLEFFGRTLYLPKIKKGGKVIEFGVSVEQMKDRSGEDDPNDPAVMKMIHRRLDVGWRTGVPNIWIWESVKKNFDVVFQTIDDLYDPDIERNRVLFLAPHDLLDQIEFVTEIEAYDKDTMALKVITSGVGSPNRGFFRNKQKTPTISLTESYKKIPTIVLEN
jgi:hypothetical protein